LAGPGLSSPMGDWIMPVFIVGWLVLQLWVLPKLGVPT
jgi:hypothetical protein